MKLARILAACAAFLFLSLPAAQAEPPLSAYAIHHVQNFVVHDAPRPVGPTTFQDAQGNQLGLDDFKGKVLLVNLWATWCAPCRHEMPSIDRLAAHLKDENFQVLAISVDRGKTQKAKEFLEEIGAKELDFYIDPTARIGAALKGFGLPLTLIIDSQGNEMGRLVGPAEWDSDSAVDLVKAAIRVGG